MSQIFSTAAVVIGALRVKEAISKEFLREMATKF